MTRVQFAGKGKKKWRNILFYLVVIVLVGGGIGELTYIITAGGGSLPVEGQETNLYATDVSGKTISLDSLQGKIVVMTWFYTHCTDECPLTMYRLEQIQNELEKQGLFGRRVAFVTMTLDPKRDTLPIIREYAEHYHADFKGWYMVRTNVANTNAILKAWGVEKKPAPDPDFLMHTLKTVLIDPSGNIRVTYATANMNPNEVVSNIKSIISRESWT